VLANMRLLCLASEGLGEDWSSKLKQIDELILQEGFDLAEESIFLTYDRAPGSVMAGESQCVIGRSVIGPKKDYPRPFQVVDWKSAPVYLYELKGNDWQNLWEECLSHWENLHRANKKISPSFMLKLKRRLIPSLTLSCSVFFYE